MLLMLFWLLVCFDFASFHFIIINGVAFAAFMTALASAEVLDDGDDLILLISL